MAPYSPRSRAYHLVDETYLTGNQGVSVAIASFSYTVLAVISLFGSVRFVPPKFAQHEHSLVLRLIGTITKRRSFISLYSTVVWSHLAFNIAAGAYFIYTLYHQVGDDTLSNCIYSYGDDLISLYECGEEFEVYRHVIICLYVVFCLLELCASSYLSLHLPPNPLRVATRYFSYKSTGACLVVSGYIVQLREEEALEYPPPAQTAATIPPMTTTYNYRREYAPSLPGKTIDV